MNLTQVIVVDQNDKVLGLMGKNKAHKGKGILHRAFSVFIFNDSGEFLIQQRSKKKPFWPGYWANTCCSHPRKGEKVLETGKRRLKEELGFTCDLKILYKFSYQAKYKDKGSENELCYVLLGKYSDQKIDFDKKEVADYKWVSLEWLKKDIKQNSDIYTPWLKIELKELARRNIFEG